MNINYYVAGGGKIKLASRRENSEYVSALLLASVAGSFVIIFSSLLSDRGNR